MKATFLILTLTASVTLGAGSAAADVLTFSSAVATFQQTWDHNLNPLQMIDGNSTPNNGWGIYRGDNYPDLNRTLSETALLTLLTPLRSGAYSLTFTLYQLHGNPGHSLGDFGFGYSTAASPTLASAQTPLVITGATSLNGTTFTFPLPGHILAGGPVPATDIYTITAYVNSAVSVTGFFLNVIDDANNGFPTGGPGRYTNGNFHVTEFAAAADPLAAVPLATSIVAQLICLGLLGPLLLWRKLRVSGCAPRIG